MKLNKDSKIAAMAKVPLFERCSPKELARIAKIADEVDLKEGEVLTTEGSRAREFFVILKGKARVSRETRLLPELGPGDFLGEIGLVADVPRTATVTAATPIHALVITDRAFRELMRVYPKIQLAVLEALATRLARTSL